MRNSQATEQTRFTQTHAPSVPLSVYRELSVECQQNKSKLLALQTQNQQLLQQNRLLRQELEQMIQATQQAVQNLPNLEENTPASRLGESESCVQPLPRKYGPAFQRMLAKQAPLSGSLAESRAFPPQKWIQEQAGPPLQRLLALQEGGSDLRGWKLGVVLSLLVFSAFGVGFLLVRPMTSR
jgi:hypothetical protein